MYEMDTSTWVEYTPPHISNWETTKHTFKSRVPVMLQNLLAEAHRQYGITATINHDTSGMDITFQYGDDQCEILTRISLPSAV